MKTDYVFRLVSILILVLAPGLGVDCFGDYGLGLGLGICDLVLALRPWTACC